MLSPQSVATLRSALRTCSRGCTKRPGSRTPAKGGLRKLEASGRSRRPGQGRLTQATGQTRVVERSAGCRTLEARTCFGFAEAAEVSVVIVAGFTQTSI